MIEGVTFSPDALAKALAQVSRLGKRGPLDAGRLPPKQFLAAALQRISRLSTPKE